MRITIDLRILLPNINFATTHLLRSRPYFDLILYTMLYGWIACCLKTYLESSAI